MLIGGGAVVVEMDISAPIKTVENTVQVRSFIESSKYFLSMSKTTT